MGYSLAVMAHSNASPSMRREWIEMTLCQMLYQLHMSPSMRREWIEICKFKQCYTKHFCLPPCGGSGLKYTDSEEFFHLKRVSLHAEGVD